MKFILSLLCATCLSGCATSPNAFPKISGWTTYTLVGQSNCPTLQTGDVLTVYPIDFGSVKVGDFVTFYPVKGGPECPGRTATHRVVAVTSQGLVTRGDGNSFNDFGVVTPLRYVGVVECASRNGKLLDLKH